MQTKIYILADMTYLHLDERGKEKQIVEVGRFKERKSLAHVKGT